MVGKGTVTFNGVVLGTGDLSVTVEEPDRFSPEDCALNDWVFASSFRAPDNSHTVRVMARPTLDTRRYYPDSGFDHYEPAKIYEFVRAKMELTDTRTVVRVWKRVR